MRRRLSIVAACLAAGLWPAAAVAQDAIATALVAEGLDSPVFLTAPAGDQKLFVVEQSGRIKVIEDGTVSDFPFLDISDEISVGGERGLLSLAFHPDYAENGRFYVNYTDLKGDTQIVAYRVSAASGIADPGAATRLLSIEQPAGNHNGGWLGFGPDGYLYIGMGDGGGAGDRFGNGQDRQSLLGKILRIDVDGASPYAIPPSNPFATGGGAPEIFALGLRNPWRAAFDGDDLYIADVGQNAWEEISVITTGDAGANLGWNIMEGSECFSEASCDTTGLVLPVHVYSHDLGCSITGGYVYRGAAMPDFQGSYFFGDYCSGAVYSMRNEDGEALDLVDWSERWGNLEGLTSFGTDSAGEIYLTLADGRVLKLVPAE